MIDYIEVLMEVLHSRDWYVKHNAASSLVKLGIPKRGGRKTEKQWR